MSELGLRVVGVDESGEMLAHLPTEVEGVFSAIEHLSLDRKWPVVLLPSHLINHPAEHVRGAFISAAKRHLTAEGTFFVKRHDPAWLAAVQPGFAGASRGVSYFVDHVRHIGNEVMMTLRYEISGQTWTQSFSTTPLSEEEVQDQLKRYGFGQFQWWGPKRLWAAAVLSHA